MDKYNIFNLVEKNPLHPLDEVIFTSNKQIIVKNNDNYEYKVGLNLRYVFTRNTFIKIKNTYIYEYDLLKILDVVDGSSFTGVVSFKKGVLYLKSIYKDKVKLKLKIAIHYLIQNKNYEVSILGSILETNEAFNHIRERFYFKKNNYTDEFAIDINENTYNINDIDNIIFLDRTLFLSTDVYDKKGNLIYENDDVSVLYKGELLDGKISDIIENGFYHILLSKEGGKREKININNNFNDEKYEFILLK